MTFNYGLSAFIPYRDQQTYARVRAIKRADITKHKTVSYTHLTLPTNREV